MTTNLHDRFNEIIGACTDPRTRFANLESQTGIKRDSWAAVWHRKQRPTAEMIESVARAWPDYAYWLACGDTEPELGHIAPPSFVPSYPIAQGKAQKWATEERIYKQALLATIPENPEDKARMNQEICDTVFKIREQLFMPAVRLNYERIMRSLNQEAKDDLFLLEYDDRLREIRINRWKEQKKLQHNICTERENLSSGKVAERRMKAGKDKVKAGWDIMDGLMKKVLSCFWKS